ncbi:SBBP repeat-containing protein [Myxococcota bacterium]|nr:SBBP repeat-containing protein [Myxococcota bacterium]MBU1379371.1 SBBP repeat-containing protein [Myxococcota bacterium]MBU1497930.1 SBBP repeat-containing protein [Myxococcota bacterium]
MKKLIIMGVLSLFLVACDDDTTVDTCGDSIVDPSEECDPAAASQPLCTDVGYWGGSSVLCNADCTMDYSPCDGHCGDGDIQTEFSEQCDGTNLADKPLCGDHAGYTGDNPVSCGSDCRFDLSMCDLKCGNGTIDEGEDCDGTVPSSFDDCGEHDPYLAGSAVTCNTDCTFNFDSCVLKTCGNNQIDNGEDCEVGNLQGQDCTDHGFYAGTLACTNCHFDTVGCVGRCGDNNITHNEECDGDQMGASDCESFGYYGGTIACDSSCSYDISDCSAFGICGDGTIQTSEGEECEDTNLNSQTCLSQGHTYGGNLACTNCQFDYTGCLGSCGDNALQTSEGEECDTTPEIDCLSIGHTYGGQVVCTSNCTHDTSGCLGYCGDGTIQTTEGENCEGTNFGGTLCSDFGYFGYYPPTALSCGSDCRRITIGCNDFVQFGTSVVDNANDITSDSAGNIYVTGKTFGALTGSLIGQSDAFLQKYSSAGQLLWTRQWGTTGNDEGNGVHVDSDGNIVVTGTVNLSKQEIFVRKFSTAGSVIGGMFTMGSNESNMAVSGNKIASDQWNNYYVIGKSTGTFDGHYSGGTSDIFIMKLDSALSKQWTQFVGIPSNNDSGNDIWIDQDGSGFATGQCMGSVTSNVCLISFTAAGVVSFVNSFGPPDVFSSGNSITVDTSNIYISGVATGQMGTFTYSGSGNDSFIIKISRNTMSPEWIWQYGGQVINSAFSIAVDTVGNIAVSGLTKGSMYSATHHGNDDIYFIKLNPDGGYLESEQYGTASNDYSTAMVYSNGYYYLAGTTNGTLGQASFGNADAFILRQ